MIEVFESQSSPDKMFHIMKLGLAKVASIGALYNFTLGILLTTGSDLIQSTIDFTNALLKDNHSLAAKEFLQSYLRPFTSEP